MKTKEIGDRYEAAASDLIHKLSGLLEIKSVEEGHGKIAMPAKSGVSWDADLVATKLDGTKIKFECKKRNRKGSRVKGAEMAAIIYEANDCGAQGILITNCKPQAKAVALAKYNRLPIIKFIPNETSVDDFKASIANLLRDNLEVIGFGEQVAVHEEWTKIIIEAGTDEP